MKTIKILSVIIIALFSLNSCIDDKVLDDDFENTPSVMSFEKSKYSATITADGSTANHTLAVLLKGPQSGAITNDITASVTVDPSSTAVEGVHYTLNTNMVTFSPSNNLINNIDFVVLSAGITAPASETLVLNLTNSSDSSILSSGRSGSVIITIQYLCFSDMGGNYSNADVPSGAAGEATTTETGAGSYTVSALPYLGWGGTTPITFDIIEDCGTITIVGGELTNAGYLTTGGGEVSADGNSFTINYIVYNGATADTGIFFDFSAAADTSTYVIIP